MHMPELRGHHLICLHFFDGKGYSETFTGNLRNIINMTGHSPVEICSGPDEVCSKCPYLKDTTCDYSINAERDIRDMDSRALELLNLSPGERVGWEDISKSVPHIFIEWYESYCKECEWITACRKNTLFQGLLADKK